MTGCYIGTPLSHLEGNSNQQFAVDCDYLLRPSQLADKMNKGNDMFYPFISFVEWA